MTTYWLNLKKCLTLSSVCFGLLLYSSFPSLAKETRPALLKKKNPIRQQIFKELAQWNTPTFQPLVQRWKTKYQGKAVPALMYVAQHKKAKEQKRYIALMAATEIGGKKATKKLLPLLKDRSWMIRSGMLRVLRRSGDANLGKAALPLLKDRALVVRSEAVQTLQVLRPAGTLMALIRTLRDPSNYKSGKALWVPQKALAALRTLQVHRSVARFLSPLLNIKNDTVLLNETIKTLEHMTGKRLKSKSSLPLRVAAWKQELKKMNSKDSLKKGKKASLKKS